MLTLIQRAFYTYRVADVLVGAAFANIGSGAFGANSALNTKVTALGAFIAFAAIGRSVYPFIAVAAGVSRKCREMRYRKCSDKHHKHQKCA